MLIRAPPSSRRPLLSEVLAAVAKGQLRITDVDTVLRHRRPFTPSSCHAGDEEAPTTNLLASVYVPMMMPPWALHTVAAPSPPTFTWGHFSNAQHAYARFYSPWISMDVSIRSNGGSQPLAQLLTA